MRPVFIWMKEPAWMTRERYPEVFARYEVSAVAPSGSPPEAAGILLVGPDELKSKRAELENFIAGDGAVVAVDCDTENPDDLLFDIVPESPNEGELTRVLRSASRYVDSQSRLSELNAIGTALSAERDHDRLLSLILSKAREITKADAGSLFLVADIDELIVHPDGREVRLSASWLKFRLAQNDSRQTRFEEDFLPISPDSIAGYVAQTGETLNLADAYNPPRDKPFVINRSFDEATGYRTRSMLVVPMINTEGQHIGVLQLINKKRSRELVLDSMDSFETQVLPFDKNDERLVRSLASQAAVSVDNNSLYVEREKLFRQFVNASVQAIESRDKTTQGHSKRVAKMTRALAEVTNRVERGPYAQFHLSPDQIRELHYAALLHDFGKVGVQEKVLIKATKLYHGELALVRQRFKTIRRTIEAEALRVMLDRLMTRDATAEQIAQMQEELAQRLSFVDQAYERVEEANKPSVSRSEVSNGLETMAALKYHDVDGSEMPYLNAKELDCLSLSRGTLTLQERKEIESHVEHTYDFLNTIPWTRDLQAIPELARSHHEKLDGTGYPNNRLAEDIPPQTRMMTISDIYDALTASDRPYKPAVPRDKALGILEREFQGKVDAELLALFIEAKVFEQGLAG